MGGFMQSCLKKKSLIELIKNILKPFLVEVFLSSEQVHVSAAKAKSTLAPITTIYQPSNK